MWIIVRRSPHRHLSEEVRHHFCRFAAHNAVFVRKRFSNDHVRRGNSKPGCRTVGWETSALFLLATIAESQTSCHLVFISEVVKSNHSGFSGMKPGWSVGRHIVVDWPVSVELYLLYEDISRGFTSQVSRCNIGENWQPLQLCGWGAVFL